MKLSVTEMQARLDQFDTIVFAHPRMSSAHLQFDSLVAQTASRISRNDRRRQQANGRPVKHDELWVLPLIGPSGSGKSTTVSVYVDNIYARDSPAADRILRERDYSEAVANEAIRHIARAKKTTIVILDEAHNLLTNLGGRPPIALAKSLKSLVNDGLFSIILVGTSDLEPLLRCDPELLSRQKETIDFRRLSLSKDDCEYFFSFVAYLEKEMVEAKVVETPLELVSGLDACGLLFDMADGVIGIVSRVLRLGLERAFMAGRRSLRWEDIALAYQGWCRMELEGGKPRHDPFVKGPKPVTATHIKAFLVGRNADAAV